MLVKLLGFRTFSLICAVSAGFFVARYPLGWAPLSAALAVYAGVLWFRPHWWLYALPALLPALNLYPWTGWLFIEEFDLAVLATLAIGYWRASPAAPITRISAPGRVAIALLAVSYAVSAAFPLRELEHWSWEALATYNTPLNGLRVLKGFAWPLLLLPLLTRAADALGDRLGQVLTIGMAAGLTMASAAVLWERNAFPGLLDFSSDYRAIGSFFEAHVGGAALDGYLALSLPFAAALLLSARTPPMIVVSSAILVLGTYATFATFSRGLYAGVAAAIAAGFVISMLRRARTSRGLGFRLSVLLAAAAVAAFVLTLVFATGGYRTLAAALGMYAAALYLGANRTTIRWTQAVGSTVVLAALTAALVLWVPKGAYLAYAISAAAFVGLLVLARAKSRLQEVFILTIPAWVAINTLAVGWHWGGAPALQDAGLAVCVAMVLALYNRTARAPLWSLNRETLTIVILGMAMLAVAIPVAGNYYMKARASAIVHDLATREDHWTTTIDLRGDSWQERIFGAGLGRYADRYFWGNRKGEFPGAVVFQTDRGEPFVRLGGARNTADVLRLSQRIPLQPGLPLTLRVTSRTSTQKAPLLVAVCEKWLLYIERCSARTRLTVNSREWSDHSAELHTGDLGRRHWWGKRPGILVFYVDGQDQVVDLTNIRLLDRSNQDLLRNGNLIDGGDSWYFTSDRSHLPWHAKNLWLGLWFDQGWFGVGSFLALTLVAVVAALRRTTTATSTAVLGSLIAFFVVGLFDTLLDATRLATAFYLLCMGATLRHKS